MTHTLIAGATVLTMKTGDPPLIDVDVLIEGDKIVEIGRDIARRTKDGVLLIDGKGMIAAPGLINAHIHLWETGFGGVGGNWTFYDYFQQMLQGIASRMSLEDIRIGNLMGAWEQLDSGCTTILDWSHALHTDEFTDAALDALTTAGIRAVFGHGTPGDDVPGWWHNSTRPHPADARRIARSSWLSRDGLITLALAVRGPNWSTEDVTTSDIQFARELNALVSMHIGVDASRDAAQGAVARLAELRLLGPDINFVHANNISPTEFKQIADAGSSITVTPEVEMQMGMGFPATGSILKAGGLPSLGTDVACSCSPDMFSQMRIALQTQRALNHAESVTATGHAAQTNLSSYDALSFATVNNARALGLSDKIGTLERGKQADIILVRPGSPSGLVAMHDPYDSMVLYSSPANVDTVMVAGHLRKRHGKLVDGPSPATALLLQKSAEKVLTGNLGRGHC